MKLSRFIVDRRFLLLFYLILMTFVSLVVYFDHSYVVSIQNIIYLNIAGIMFLSFYLTSDFLRLRKYYKTINYILQNNHNNLVPSLPEPLDYCQQINHEILLQLDRNYSKIIDNHNLEKKQYADYVNSWVHEVKTPIAVSKLIIESNQSNANAQVLGSLEDELDSIENYVDQALYYSRLESFSKDYLLGDLNLAMLVKELVRKNAKSFITKKIKIELGALDYIVRSDKKWLAFILGQILSNSLKYTGTGGIISIAAEHIDDGHKLVITDNGIGIKSEDLPRIFDKGFTGSNGRDSSLNKSTGIGLYLSKTLCEKLGHKLGVESELGKFTRITLHFPKLLDYHNVTN